ncbi:DEAD/DEAH box helicase, partial [bacterium]
NVCYKPKIKCTDCTNKAFVPFDENAVRDHLTGKTAIGSYAITTQDRCCFLAADFDKSTWKDDVVAYQKAAEDLHVQVAIEISKSGNGAHAWIFFESPVSAGKARKMGDLILSNAMDNTNTYNLDSYDRFFPNQDYLPSGGFGNLIALPLQKTYRDQSRSIFVDKNFECISDQWAFLSAIQCISEKDLEGILNKHLTSFEDSWQHSKDGKDIDNNIHIAESILNTEHEYGELSGGTIEIILGGQIAVPIGDLPGVLLRQLKKLATIANPKFFETQALRFSTWNIPKYIFCGENDSEYIYLPRGKLSQIKNLLTENGFDVSIKDIRNENEKLEVSFNGELYKHQHTAIQAVKDTDFAVLVAPTGTGKTVMAIKLLTIRKMRTLILVHRGTLIEQWIDSLCRFIPEIEKKHIGVLGAGRKKLKGTIDIAMIQTLAAKEDLDDLTGGYDFLIVDECHRIPTPSFEPVLKAIKARNILGLTATPQRKDHFQSIIFMQCGPIGYTVADVHKTNQNRMVYFRSTDIPELPRDGTIQDMWETLVGNESRNDFIISDIVNLLRKKKAPLVLSDRIDHIDRLAELLVNYTEAPVFILKGSIGKKEREEIINNCKDLFRKGIPFCLFATGSLIGEGFDFPDFDTMALTLPISFKGRLTQYVGRLHRQSTDEKKDITVYDYVDTCSGMTISMFKKRIQAYKKLGYIFQYDLTDKIARWL